MKIKDFIYIGIILILSGYCAYLHNNKIESIDIISTDTIYIKKDSIITIIKESQNTINKIDVEYKKDYIHITNQSSSGDLEFFSKYIDSQNLE